MNAYEITAEYRTDVEKIYRLLDGSFTEGYKDIKEFSSDPGFRVVWEYTEEPAVDDNSFQRLNSLWADEDALEKHWEEAKRLKLLWEKALSLHGKGWALRVRTGYEALIKPGTHIGGSGRDRGLETYTPECTVEEAQATVENWLKYQANVDRFLGK